MNDGNGRRRPYVAELTVLSEILAARVCGGSKFAKKKIIRKS
jgi:hypothetical protein